jgi:hypothetical protein
MIQCTWYKSAAEVAVPTKALFGFGGGSTEGGAWMLLATAYTHNMTALQVKMENVSILQVQIYQLRTSIVQMVSCCSVLGIQWHVRRKDNVIEHKIYINLTLSGRSMSAPLFTNFFAMDMKLFMHA